VRDLNLSSTSLNKLLLLKLIEGGVSGSTRLQKMVFIVEQRCREQQRADRGFAYPFIRHLYGPYSEELHTDLAFLVRKGYVGKSDSMPVQYCLTEKGEKLLRGYSDQLPEAQVNYIAGAELNRLRKLPLQTLLDEVYEDYKVKSYDYGDRIDR